MVPPIANEAAADDGRVAHATQNFGSGPPVETATANGLTNPHHGTNRIACTRLGKEARPFLQKKLRGLDRGARVILLIDAENKVTDLAIPPG